MKRQILCSVGIAVMLAVTGCKSDQQRRDELVAQHYREKQRQEHELEVLRSRQRHQMYLQAERHQHELDQQKIEEEAALEKTKTIAAAVGKIAAIVVGALTICFVLYLICRTVVMMFVERQKTYRCTQMMAIIADGRNGLTNAQREAFIGKLLSASGRPSLPPPTPPPAPSNPPPPPAPYRPPSPPWKLPPLPTSGEVG